jgi:hypothetical protein
MKALALFLAVLLLAGCGSRAAGPASGDVSFSRQVQPIFAQTCMPCHAGGKDTKGSYDLTCYAGAMGNGSDTISNVIPGNADSSTLCRRVSDTVPPQMPKGRPALNAAQLATIQKWIGQGAKNN